MTLPATQPEILDALTPEQEAHRELETAMEVLTRAKVVVVTTDAEYSEADARQVLTDNDIAYVFYGPDEQALTTTSEFYPSLLVPVYNNPTVTVFKVIK